jgi:hypothetical protein
MRGALMTVAGLLWLASAAVLLDAMHPGRSKN